MSDGKGQDRTERISLRSGGRRVDARKGEGQTVRQSFSHGRSKAVAVEVKRSPQARRPAAKGAPGREDAPAGKVEVAAPTAERPKAASPRGGGGGRRPMVLKPLTDDERKARQLALVEARRREEEQRKRAEIEAKRQAEEEAKRQAAEAEAARLAAEEEARRKAEAEAKRAAEEAAQALLATEQEAASGSAVTTTAAGPAEAAAAAPEAAPAATDRPARPGGPRPTVAPAGLKGDEEEAPRGKNKRAKTATKSARRDDTRRGGRIQIDAEEGDLVERRGPSLAALRRRQERERRSRHVQSTEPQLREVVLPETITVSELANRMAVRGAEVVRTLMKMDVMASVTQTIDADTAELVVTEFGHTPKRVSEADVLEGLEGPDDDPSDLVPRAPVVTVMGHVDHGKTSLLDALRNADVVASEAGGITQHIGAYRVIIGNGHPVSFIDTPGHAAFTEMRSRGAKVTDVVILVVAANDGVMPQTVEAISHAKAAGVPIVVAINKMDLPDANPTRVKNELLEHDLVPEDFGGDVQCVPVSATAKTGLDELIEAVQLQAEVLELKSNPNREGQGAIIEARLDRGRGVVATVLVQRGTLRVGDIVVCGANWGRIRAMINDRGQSIEEAGPSVPAEILGLDGVPTAGDRFDVVDSERRAREIADYHGRRQRDAQIATGVGKGSVDDLFKALQEGSASELPVVIKTDVHGSLEAIQVGLDKLSTNEVKVRVLHGGVGGITESDVTLARASSALVIGFNVRANAQARDMAKRDGVELRYYSIIYELLDDAKDMLSGMLAPESRETITGRVEIREVFNITKVGKVAGCRVLDGLVRRGARVRLLRDDVVVYDGELASLRRFKEDVREVKEGFECGMSIAGYNDIRQGDLIEAYEVQEVARSL